MAMLVHARAAKKATGSYAKYKWTMLAHARATTGITNGPIDRYHFEKKNHSNQYQVWANSSVDKYIEMNKTIKKISSD